MPGFTLFRKSKQSQQCGQLMPLHAKHLANTSPDRVVTTALEITTVGSSRFVNATRSSDRVSLSLPATAPPVRSSPAQRPSPAQRYGRGNNPLSRWR